MCSAKDDDTRRDILRSGLRAWHRRADSAWHSLHSFLQLFRRQWRVLPEDEARDEIRSMVRVMRERPDERLTGSFGGLRGTVTFSSYRPSLLFELLGPLKRLDPELADTVIRENPELARAAEVYHTATTPISTGRSNSRPPKRWSNGKGLGRLCTRMRFFRIEDEKNGDFRDSFDHALRSFARDTDPAQPNAVPARVLAVSEDFRTILYAAGRYDGEAAPASSTEYPTRRFACSRRSSSPQESRGLDQIGGITREQGRGD